MTRLQSGKRCMLGRTSPHGSSDKYRVKEAPRKDQLACSLDWARSSGGIASICAGCNGSSNQKVAPGPGLLLEVPILPPMISTNCLLIVSPRPVPPKRRRVVPSAWKKASKIRSRTASSTPIPVSMTVHYIDFPSEPCCREHLNTPLVVIFMIFCYSL